MVEQNISITALVEIIGGVFGIIISAIVITRTIKKSTHAYVDDKAKETDNKIDKLDMKILTIDKEMSELKKDNQREHDDIKREFVQKLDFIVDWIKSKTA